MCCFSFIYVICKIFKYHGDIHSYMSDSPFRHPIHSDVVSNVATDMDVDRSKLHDVLANIQSSIVDDIDILRTHPTTVLLRETPGQTQLLCGEAEWNVIDDRAINDDVYREAASACHSREIQRQDRDNIDDVMVSLTVYDALIVGVDVDTDYADFFTYDDWVIDYNSDVDDIGDISARVSGTISGRFNPIETVVEYHVDTDSNSVVITPTITINNNQVDIKEKRVSVESIVSKDTSDVDEITAWIRDNQDEIGLHVYQYIVEHVEADSCKECGTIHNPEQEQFVMEYPLPDGSVKQLCHECYADIVADETYFSNREAEVLALMYHDVNYVEIGEIFGTTKGCVAAFKHRMSNKLTKQERTENVINGSMTEKL